MEATDGKKLKNLDLENCEVLVQDESAFVSDVSQYNWSRKGVKAVYRGYRYGTRINCFGSLNINNGNIILTKEIRGNSHTMINHLNVVRKHYPIEKKLIIFTDNASWHKTKKLLNIAKRIILNFGLRHHMHLNLILLKEYGVS